MRDPDGGPRRPAGLRRHIPDSPTQVPHRASATQRRAAPKRRVSHASRSLQERVDTYIGGGQAVRGSDDCARHVWIRPNISLVSVRHVFSYPGRRRFPLGKSNSI